MGAGMDVKDRFLAAVPSHLAIWGSSPVPRLDPDVEDWCRLNGIGYDLLSLHINGGWAAAISFERREHHAQWILTWA